jgi:hypothetical protein
VEDGRVVLRVGGVIQSVAVDDGYESDVWDACCVSATAEARATTLSSPATH